MFHAYQYELVGYSTKSYNKHDKRIIFSGRNVSKMQDWIDSFLAKHPDGKIIITILNNKSWQQQKPHRKKFKTITKEGENYVQGN